MRRIAAAIRQLRRDAVTSDWLFLGATVVAAVVLVWLLTGCAAAAPAKQAVGLGNSAANASVNKPSSPLLPSVEGANPEGIQSLSPGLRGTSYPG
jgi:hypothetical protein